MFISDVEGNFRHDSSGGDDGENDGDGSFGHGDGDGNIHDGNDDGNYNDDDVDKDEPLYFDRGRKNLQILHIED